MASIQLEFNKALNKNLSNILVFYVALYVRLSKVDESKSKDEQSRSISNQKEICKAFLNELREQDHGVIEYRLVGYYVDDGYTGSNFDRPSFTKLKDDILSKKINMVITKDLSRLGREHIESDNFIERWFPEHDTRYISILDNIDTFSDTTSNEIVPILNWANERHNRETSKKIKRTFRNNINDGLFMGSQPPYGYLRNPDDKHKLVVDESVREVIIDIFNQCKNGMSLNKIAEYLTKKGISIPSIHTNSNRGLKTKNFEYWDPNTVKDILTNEMYLGHMVQGKTTKLSLKSKKITYIPKEDWVKVYNTHEAIIDEETFTLVQMILEDNSHKQKNSNDYFLKSMLKCKECGHTMSIQKNKNAKTPYTVCNYYKKFSKYGLCTPHRFNYNLLEEIIINTIKNECKKYVDSTKFEKLLKAKDKNNNRLKEIKILKKKSSNDIARFKKQIENMYLDKLNNNISEDLFQVTQKTLYKKIRNEEDTIKQLDNELEILNTQNHEEPDYKKIIDDYLSFKNPNKILLIHIIDRIEISENGTIDIYFRCNLNNLKKINNNVTV